METLGSAFREVEEGFADLFKHGDGAGRVGSDESAPAAEVHPPEGHNAHLLRLPSLFRRVSALDIIAEHEPALGSTPPKLPAEGGLGSAAESSAPSSPAIIRQLSEGLSRASSLGPLRRLNSRKLSLDMEAVPENEPLASVAEPLTPLESRQTVFLGEGATRVNVLDFARSMIINDKLDDNFYVYDLCTVQHLYAAWVAAMPRVHPFYAVKCNPDHSMLATLAALGAGFDCASQGEIERVLELGVDPERIIYAHPCKPPRQIRCAAAKGIGITTFDTPSELHKMAADHPSCGLLLRIRADDPTATCQLGNKFGAEMSEVPKLLSLAKELGLAVKGVSFHVGSGSHNPMAFRDAIERARKVFDQGLALGFDMCVLDLGGGYTGGSLGAVPAAVNEALDRLFPDGGKLQVVAEPGRYFAEAAATYFCCVNGYREREVDGKLEMDYYISDGIYGSMNALLYDHIKLQPRVVRNPLLPPLELPDEADMHSSTLYGPTCDGLDTFCANTQLPRLRNGDFLMFPRFGAYTVAGAVNFNGFDVAGAKCFYFYTS